MRPVLALAAVLALWVALAVLWAATVGAELGVAQEVAPEPSLLAAACNQAGALAEASALGFQTCRLVGVSQFDRFGNADPNSAIVTVRVKIRDQGWFQVKVFLARQQWNAQTYTITPEVR